MYLAAQIKRKMPAPDEVHKYKAGPWAGVDLAFVISRLVWCLHAAYVTPNSIASKFLGLSE